MDATSTHPAPLDRGARHLVVLSALVSSLLLWIAAEGQRSGWPPFDLLGGRVAWYVLVIALPTTLALSVRRLDDARFWRQSLGIGLAWLLAAGWAAWQATGEPPPSSDAVLTPFAAIAAIALFVLLPFAQGRLEGHGWHAPYPRLFEHAWGNAYALALGLLAVGLGWLVLWLAAELFELVHRAGGKVSRGDRRARHCRGFPAPILPAPHPCPCTSTTPRATGASASR